MVAGELQMLLFGLPWEKSSCSMNSLATFCTGGTNGIGKLGFLALSKIVIDVDKTAK
jgi:hypothetical protein